MTEEKNWIKEKIEKEVDICINILLILLFLAGIWCIIEYKNTGYFFFQILGIFRMVIWGCLIHYSILGYLGHTSYKISKKLFMSKKLLFVSIIYETISFSIAQSSLFLLFLVIIFFDALPQNISFVTVIFVELIFIGFSIGIRKYIQLISEEFYAFSSHEDCLERRKFYI